MIVLFIIFSVHLVSCPLDVKAKDRKVKDVVDAILFLPVQQIQLSLTKTSTNSGNKLLKLSLPKLYSSFL